MTGLWSCNQPQQKPAEKVILNLSRKAVELEVFNSLALEN
jgi:hypothetical protein